MSDLEIGIAHLIAVFHSYSGKEGDKYKLNKSELKSLLVAELGLDKFSNTEVQKIFQSLDADGDGEVDFKEYVVMVASLAMATNEFFQKQ